MADLSRHRFSATHEWVVIDGSSATVGISDHAQAQLGDVIFLELPAVGQALAVGERFGVIESVKAASDLYSPVAGTVSEVNTALTGSPESVNTDAYGEGWMIRLTDVQDNPELMDADAYEKVAGDH